MRYRQDSEGGEVSINSTTFLQFSCINNINNKCIRGEHDNGGVKLPKIATPLPIVFYEVAQYY